MPEAADDGLDDNEPDAFTRVFGVSEAELTRNGVDISQYVQKHATKAVRNEKNMAFIWAKAPQSEQTRHRARIWGLRCYKFMFASFGLLILSTFNVLSPIRDVCLALSVLGLACVVFSLLTTYRLILRSRRLRRSGN